MLKIVVYFRFCLHNCISYFGQATLIDETRGKYKERRDGVQRVREEKIGYPAAASNYPLKIPGISTT